MLQHLVFRVRAVLLFEPDGQVLPDDGLAVTLVDTAAAVVRVEHFVLFEVRKVLLAVELHRGLEPRRGAVVVVRRIAEHLADVLP